MANISLATAKNLCSAAELKLIRASRRPEIGKLDAKALKKHLAQARKWRDKWWDQSVSQRRAKQRATGARTTDAAARSKQKAQLFDDALQRFGERLEATESKRPKRTDTSKKTGTQRAIAKAKRPIKKRAKKAAASKGANTKKSTRPPKQTLDQGELSPAAIAQRHLSRDGSTKALARQRRIAASGLTTRTRGHVSARTKRSQARRDSKQ